MEKHQAGRTLKGAGMGGRQALGWGGYCPLGHSGVMTQSALPLTLISSLQLHKDRGTLVHTLQMRNITQLSSGRAGIAP